MPVETANFNGTSSLTWTSTARNVLGARGIDALSTETSGGTVSTYPLYDTHGNVKAYVKKEPSNSWSSLGWKQYNVWGGDRSTSGGAGTTSAYCGNLGHVSDLETGLIYMRARYYAPWAGRFISEDPATQGDNWFIYCGGDPVNRYDPSGKTYISINNWYGPIVSILTMIATAMLDPVVRLKAAADLAFLMTWFGVDMDSRMSGSASERVLGSILINGMIDIIAVGVTWDKYAAQLATSVSPGAKAVLLALEHMAFISLFMSLNELSEG